MNPSAQILQNRQAADEYEALGRRLEQQGNAPMAEAAYEAAADIDLKDDELQASWGGPFNGQVVRQRIVSEVLEAFPFDALVETGTFRATTTVWIAERFSKPILTCEINKRYYLQSRKRLSGFGHVEVALADSTEYLRGLAQRFGRETLLLFYLDAHWLDRLPLFEEIGIIRDSFPRSVVIIDDFEVPLDRGYRFDNYGPGKRIDLNLLAPYREQAHVFLPSGSSADETGAKRGVAVLTWGATEAATLAQIPTLRAADDRDWSAARLMVELEAATSAGGPLVQIGNQLSAEVQKVGIEVARASEILPVAVEDRVKELAVGVAGAVANAMLSPTPAGSDPDEDAGWGPFLTAIRKAIGPLRVLVAEQQPSDGLLERLGRATATEVQLRGDITRLEYRAIAAEKEAEHTRTRFEAREERRAQEEHLLRRLLGELEPENARLSRLFEEVRAENDRLQQAIQETRAQEGKVAKELRHLRDEQGVIARSRWIRVGTRLGLSKLDRHLQP